MVQLGVALLQQAVSADMVFVGVGVEDDLQRCICQVADQLSGGVGATAVDQCIPQLVAGGPVAAFAEQAARQVEAGDCVKAANLDHRLKLRWLAGG